MSDPQSDDGLQELLLDEERAGYKYDAATRRAAGSLSYPEAREMLRGVLRFSDETDYDAVLLFAAATRVVELLTLVWYLSFAGAKSSGKTTAARVARFLSHHVIEAGQLTAAGLPAAMRIANGLLLDEVDVLLRREGGDMIAGILRQGTDRSTPYLRMTETGRDRAWRLVAVPVFGPKILTFKRAVDDALASRSDLIRMPRARDPKIRRASTRFRKTLLPLKAWLDLEGRRVLREWGKADVEAYLDSPDFIGQSDRLRTELDRSGQLGDLMILVGHIYGWPTGRVVQARLGVIEDATTDEEVEEVRRALLFLYADRRPVRTVDGSVVDDGVLLLKKSAIKARVDLDRRAASAKPIWINRVAEALDELGFERDERFSKTDREKAIRLTPESVARIQLPLSGGEGTEGSVGGSSSEDLRGPHPGPSLSEEGPGCGPQAPPAPRGPQRRPGELDGGPSVGPSVNNEENSGPGPAVPAVPAPHGHSVADPEDLFEGHPSRADRARARLDRSGDP